MIIGAVKLEARRRFELLYTVFKLEARPRTDIDYLHIVRIRSGSHGLETMSLRKRALDRLKCVT